jgi:hypothetical protein
MFLLLAFTTTIPCKLADGFSLELEAAAEMAKAFGVPRRVASIPHPMFGEDHLMTIDILPRSDTRPNDLFFTVTHTEPLVLPGAGAVTENLVIDRYVITERGFVLGGGTCESRLGVVEILREALLQEE